MTDSIALLLMTHGNLGKAAIESAELIVGKQENFDTISIFAVDEVNNLKQDMLNKVSRLDTGKGLIVLTDIIGGTPTNLASYLLEDEHTVLVSGLNLPILIEILMNRNENIKSIIENIKEAYHEGFTIRTNEDIKKGGDEAEYSL